MVEPLTSRIARPACLSPPAAGLADARAACSSHRGRADLLPGAPSGAALYAAMAMRYADPFRDAGRPETTDHDFVLTCSCGTEQRLDEMTVDETGVVTLYDCKRCAKSIVGVLTDDPDLEKLAPQALTRWQEKAGHHLRGYIIGARVDVALRPEGDDQDMLRIPATRYFFEQYANL